MTTVLVIGGSGVFGRRLAEGLLRLESVEVVLAGRNRGRLETTARALGTGAPEASVRTLTLDTRNITTADIEASGAGIVIDAAGPFQGARPRVAEAAIAAGRHYADLADARDFVAAFPCLDGAARRAGVVALTGVSSTPALSHAALDALTAGWQRIDTIRVGIAPGNQAPRGPSVVRAILSWVGAPVSVFEDGEWRTRHGWSGTRPAGIGDLDHRPLALADTPDLDLLVARYRPTRSARFEAGLELAILHYGLAAAGWLRRMRLAPGLAPFAGPARWVAERLLRFGTDRGGMIVEVTGRDANDEAAYARWTLVAEAGDGPYVPTLAAVALVERLARGGALAPGARACAGDLTLAEITARMKPHRILTEQRTGRLDSVFQRALRDTFAALPESVRRAHAGAPFTRLRGRGGVDGAETLVGRLIARAVGLPPALDEVDVEVEMQVFADGREVWSRRFAGHRFRSTLRTDRRGTYSEAFGPITVELSIAADARRVTIAPLRCRLGRLPLPRALSPRGAARESVDREGRFTFDVAVSFPAVGRVARYHGWLRPVGPRGGCGGAN